MLDIGCGYGGLLGKVHISLVNGNIYSTFIK